MSSYPSENITIAQSPIRTCKFGEALSSAYLVITPNQPPSLNTALTRPPSVHYSGSNFRIALPSFDFDYRFDQYELDKEWVGTDTDLVWLIRNLLVNRHRVVFEVWYDTLKDYVTYVFGSLMYAEELQWFHIPSNSNETYYAGWCSYTDTFYEPVELTRLLEYITDMLLICLLDIHQTLPIMQFGWLNPDSSQKDLDGNFTFERTRLQFFEFQVAFVPPDRIQIVTYKQLVHYIRTLVEEDDVLSLNDQLYAIFYYDKSSTSTSPSPTIEDQQTIPKVVEIIDNDMNNTNITDLHITDLHTPKRIIPIGNASIHNVLLAYQEKLVANKK